MEVVKGADTYSTRDITNRPTSEYAGNQDEKKRAGTPTSRGRGRGRGKSYPLPELLPLYADPNTGMTYKPGESAYLECNRREQSSSLCLIKEFKQSSRGVPLVTVNWYYKPSELPPSVYQLLVQDRQLENKAGCRRLLEDPVIKASEVFLCTVTDTYPARCLRDKCHVINVLEPSLLTHFKPLRNCFFYIFEYNPQTRRLATIQGEIRVGQSYQARLPPCQPGVRPEDMVEQCQDRETLIWKPSSVLDPDLMMYLRAARSMAAFVGMCDGGSTEDGCIAASMDETTISALDQLHKHDYDTGRALQALVKTINPQHIDKRWSEDDAKKFSKGYKTYGKDFFRIQKELLPCKETRHLVEYYYFWKKTPAALNTRPPRRHRRGNRLTRQANAQRSASGEGLDVSSASELSDNESDDSDTRELNFSCCHCYTTKSKDWHHAGKDNGLLCNQCMYYKNYGEDLGLDEGHHIPPFMFKPVRDDINGSHSMRNRLNPQLLHDLSKKRHRDTSVSDSDDSKNLKRKKEQESSDGAESSTDSSSGSNDEETAHDGDIENNQDDVISTASSSVPSPLDNDVDYKPPAYLKDRKAAEGATSPAEGAVESNANPEAKADCLNPAPPCESSEHQQEQQPQPQQLPPQQQPSVEINAITATSEASAEQHSDNKSTDSDSDSKSEASSQPESEGQGQGQGPGPGQSATPSQFTPLSVPVPSVIQTVKMEPRGAETTPSSQGAGPGPGSGPLPQDRLPERYRSALPPGVPMLPHLYHPYHPGVHLQPPLSNPHFPAQQSHSHMLSPIQVKQEVITPTSSAPSSSSSASASSDSNNMDSSSTGKVAPRTLYPPPSQPPPHPTHPGAQQGAVAPPASEPLEQQQQQQQQPQSHPQPLHQSPQKIPPPSSSTSSSPSSRSLPGGVETPLKPAVPVPLHGPPPLVSAPGVTQPTVPAPGVGLSAPTSATYPSLMHIKQEVKQEPLDHHVARSRSPLHSPRGSHALPPHLHQTPHHHPHGHPHRQHTPPPQQQQQQQQQQLPPGPLGPLPTSSHPHPGHPPSPTRRSPPPSPHRSRSRSPVLDSDSDSVDLEPRSPSPEARIVNEKCHTSKHAIFIKHWFRGRNTCSRCDFEFSPLPGSPLSKKREERCRSQAPPAGTSRPTVLTSPGSLKTEDKGDRKHEEPSKKRAETPPDNPTADAQVTSSLMNQQALPPYGPPDRLTPRSAHANPGYLHDPTPALRQLSEYARPHTIAGGQEPGRFPYGLSLPHPGMDPYRMASLYPPGSRERLELELERDKRERDAREREIREQELREIEMREKMKRELEMKPPGFDRLPLDPHWVEAQRRYAASLSQPGGSQLGPGGSHIPGVYHPTSLANDLLQRERERLERLGMPPGGIPSVSLAGLPPHVVPPPPETVMAAERLQHAERLQAERMSLATDPLVRLQMAGISPSSQHTHAHSHSHTHLHLHQPDGIPGLPPSVHPLAAGAPHLPPPVPPGADPLAAAAVAAAAQGQGQGHLPPGHPLMEAAARQQELMYRDLLNRPHMDPVLAHQLSAQAAQHEAIQRQLAIERERLGPGGPHLH